MAQTTYGRPLVTGSVLRSDVRARPTAREPSQTPARGFPIAIGLSTPPGPRPIHPTPVQCYRPRSTRFKGRATGAPSLPRTCRTLGVPPRSEVIAIARARFNTNLLP
jgi:hypothetical protein